MKQLLHLLITLNIAICMPQSCHAQTNSQSATHPLTELERYVIEQKGTEMPFSGEYNDFFEAGTYVCKRCGATLYHSTDKFKSSCGWPSFDDEVEGAVRRLPDADGERTEIQCAKCGAHLGHVFLGEGFTAKNTRHCVNSVSLQFIPATTKDIYFAGGCFWGTEHFFKQLNGVLQTEVGYANGHTDNPTYQEVCTDQTGFAEAVHIIYDPSILSLQMLTEMYFKTIDPTSVNRQGNDIGSQYRTGIFYTDNADQPLLQRIYNQVQQQVGQSLAVQLRPLENFFTAEEYHQDYLDKHPNGYCHIPDALFQMAREANR